MSNSVRETIFETIRDEITYGGLLPGERLTENGLSEKYKASRSTIRECLRLLEGEGLLTYARNKGYRVSKLSAKQVEELYELRGLLFAYATRLAADKATKAQVGRLKRLQEGCRKAAVKADLKSWIRYNDQLHNFFHVHCGNENLKMLLETLLRRTYRYKYVVLTASDQFASYLEAHENIIAACDRQDGRAAEKAMRKHLEHVKKVMLDYLNKLPGLYPR